MSRHSCGRMCSNGCTFRVCYKDRFWSGQAKTLELRTTFNIFLQWCYIFVCSIARSLKLFFNRMVFKNLKQFHWLTLSAHKWLETEKQLIVNLNPSTNVASKSDCQHFKIIIITQERTIPMSCLLALTASVMIKCRFRCWLDFTSGGTCRSLMLIVGVKYLLSSSVGVCPYFLFWNAISQYE